MERLFLLECAEETDESSRRTGAELTFVPLLFPLQVAIVVAERIQAPTQRWQRGPVPVYERGWSPRKRGCPSLRASDQRSRGKAEGGVSSTKIREEIREQKEKAHLRVEEVDDGHRTEVEDSEEDKGPVG